MKRRDFLNYSIGAAGMFLQGMPMVGNIISAKKP